MSGKGGGGKRKAEADDAIVVEGDGAAAKKPAKKAKGADKPPPKPKVIKLKPFTEIEERVAKGASMARNEAIALFLDGIREAYKSGVRLAWVARARALTLPALAWLRTR